MADFVGKAKGMGEDVEVKISVNGAGVLSKMVAKGPNETPKVGGKAIEKFNKEIFPKFVDKNMEYSFSEVDYSKIDAVTGASLTSNAIRKAAAIAAGQKDGSANSEVDNLNKKVNYLNQQVTKIEDGKGLSRYALKEWLKDRGNVAAAAGASAFLKGKENAPTKEELKEILFMAGNYTWCHELTSPHYIVIRDSKEQANLLHDMGVTGDGTVTILVLADNVKAQDYHQEKYTDHDTPFDQEHYWRSPYALYEAGEAGAMLNLAARTHGYRIRTFGAIDLYDKSVEERYPETKGMDVWHSGSAYWKYIQEDTWDFDKYSKDKETGKPFKHYFLGGFTDGKMTGRMVDVAKNLQLVCAIVIGKIDETDAVTGASASTTGYEQNQNFSFWD